jgi:hypothetical protein
VQVWSYFGERERRALTPSEVGDDLPSEFAPWVRYALIELGETNGADRAAREAIRENGFYLYSRADNPAE